MKNIITHKNGKITDIKRTGDSITIENIAVVNDIPKFEPKEGYNGVLMYSAEKGIYWDYEEAPIVETSEYGIDNETYNQIIDEYTANIIEQGII